MRTRYLLSVLACATVGVGVTVGSGAAAEAQTSFKPLVHLHARYASFPVKGLTQGQIMKKSRNGATVPLWSASVKSPIDGNTYHYTIVGKNPNVAQSNANSVIPTDVVPVNLYFESSGIAMDPTLPYAPCGLKTSPLARTLQSPLFNNHSYSPGGINVGDVQYESAFMRENFWSDHAKNPTYGIQLTATPRPEAYVWIPPSDGQTVPASQTGACGPLGLVNIASWDPFVQKDLIPSLEAHGYTSPTHMLVLLLTNVVMYDGTASNCCILGYHSGMSTAAGVQYYATADYDSSGAFKGSDDVSALSHELGEWLNDPNGNNATPAWGHIGQVSGCQNNLEVGDPLSGTTVAVTMPNGVTYHPQELAFVSWFYRTPSTGIHGWFSSNGTFKTNAGKVC